MPEFSSEPNNNPGDSTIENHNGVHLITLPPEIELDSECIPAWDKLLTETIESPESTSVVVDMSSVAYLGSSALGSLLNAERLANKSKKPLVIDLATPEPTGNSQATMRVFQVTGLDKVFTIVTAI